MSLQVGLAAKCDKFADSRDNPPPLPPTETPRAPLLSMASSKSGVRVGGGDCASSSSEALYVCVCVCVCVCVRVCVCVCVCVARFNGCGRAAPGTLWAMQPSQLFVEQLHSRDSLLEDSRQVPGGAAGGAGVAAGELAAETLAACSLEDSQQAPPAPPPGAPAAVPKGRKQSA